MNTSLVSLLNRYRIKVAISMLVIILLAFGFVVFQLAAPTGSGSNVQLIDCVKGAPFYRTAIDLERKGIIRNARLFALLARVRGEDNKVQAGTYQINDAMSPSDILRKMVAGEVYAYRFAIPEGYSIYQIAELLDGRSIFKKEDFLATCSDKTLLKELKIPGPTVEGYLYPSTYSITPRMTPAETIGMMVSQFEKVNAELFAGFSEKGGKSRHAIVILASMIEKEAAVASDKPLIASVFANRLKRHMRLQCDPTAVYGVRAFAGNVTRSDIKRKTPYNTYMIDGLPPGPIGNPGAEALQAAVSPAKTEFLYFVAKKDGAHFFSKTLDQHNSAVTKYLRGN